MGNAYTVQVISDLARQVVACKDRGSCLARQVVVAYKDRGMCLARVEFLGIILSELVL